MTAREWRYKGEGDKGRGFAAMKPHKHAPKETKPRRKKYNLEKKIDNSVKSGKRRLQSAFRPAIIITLTVLGELLPV